MSEAGSHSAGGGAGGATRCGFIAVIGAPNAGQSTLVNALVGAKVAIVSHKVQTVDDDVQRILDRLKDAPAPRLAALNKIDRVPEKAQLLSLAQALEARVPFEKLFMISAESGDGVADLKAYLAVPHGPWHYPADDLSDAPLRVAAAEITREKIYNRLHDEVPYASTVETTSWQERKDGSVRIEQTIYVARDGQKAIVLGKGGQTIKQISTESRRELAEMLERPVHLFLFVKVRSSWQDDPERYREMGLEIPKK
jgi:GTP-binding protein Era